MNNVIELLIFLDMNFYLKIKKKIREKKRKRWSINKLINIYMYNIWRQIPKSTKIQWNKNIIYNNKSNNIKK